MAELLFVPRAAFLKATDPDALLSLMGLHCAKHYMWKHHAMQLACNLLGDGSLRLPDGMDLRKMRDYLLDELRDICDMSGIEAGAMD